MPGQSLLNFPTDSFPDFEVMVGEKNAELLYQLKNESVGLFYLWGPEGAGKSLLLKAWARSSPDSGAAGVFISLADRAELEEIWNLPIRRFALGDIDRWDERSLQGVFNLINRLKQDGGRLAVSAQTPPSGLAMREDLRSRLAQGLAYEIQPMDDAELARAVRAYALCKGIELNGACVSYLFNRVARDLNGAFEAVDKLAVYSAQTQRRVTVWLIQRCFGAPNPGSAPPGAEPKGEGGLLGPSVGLSAKPSLGAGPQPKPERGDGETGDV